MRLGVAVALVAALAIAVRLRLGARLEPKAALGSLTQIKEKAWAIPAFAASYLALTTALAPAVLFHMISGAAWGFGKGLAVNVAVFNAAAHAHFWLARWAGRARVDALVRALGVARWAERISRVGLASAIAVRVLPVPTLVASASAGVSGMRWRDFAVGSLLGALPWIAIYTYFAASLVAGVEGAERQAFLEAFAAAALILLGTAAPRAWRWVAARRP